VQRVFDGEEADVSPMVLCSLLVPAALIAIALDRRAPGLRPRDQQRLVAHVAACLLVAVPLTAAAVTAAGSLPGAFGPTATLTIGQVALAYQLLVCGWTMRTCVSALAPLLARR
jgi:hypothetical protein